jgi:hypothetical protein
MPNAEWGGKNDRPLVRMLVLVIAIEFSNVDHEQEHEHDYDGKSLRQ